MGSWRDDTIAQRICFAPDNVAKAILCPEARNTREHKQRVYRSACEHLPWLIGFKNLHARHRHTGMLTSNCTVGVHPELLSYIAVFVGIIAIAMVWWWHVANNKP
jgi:hypothetical protein